MPERTSLTRTLNVTTARQNFSQLLNQVYRRRIHLVIEKSGIPVAAVIPADDLERYHRWEEERRERFAVIHQAQAAFAGTPPDEIEREIAAAIAAVRAERHRAPSTPAT